MPYLQMPSGNVYKAPEGMPYEVALAKARADYPQEFGIKPEEGFLSNLKKSAKDYLEQWTGGVAEGISPGAGRAALQRNADDQSVASTNWEDVKKAYGERGLFGDAQGPGGLSSLGAFARDTAAQSLPQMAGTMGAAQIGALAGAATPIPFGALIGGGIGAAIASVPAFAGQNMQTQLEEQKARGVEQPLNRGAAWGAAVPQAALDVGSSYLMLGKLGFGKAIGKSVEEMLAKSAAQMEKEAIATAQRSLMGAAGRGAAKGVVSEMPTEIAQQVLQRAQANQDLFSPDALKEYEGVAAGAGILGGAFGTVGGMHERGQARQTVDAVKRREDAKAAKEALDKEEAFKLTPEYAKQITEQYNSGVAEHAALKAQHDALSAQIKEATGQDKRDLVEQRKELKTQLSTLGKELNPIAREYKEHLGRLEEETAVPPEYGDLARQKPFTPPAPQPLPPGMEPQPGEEVPAGYEDLAIRGEQRAPGAAPRLPTRLQPTQFLTQFTSPEARMAGEQFPDWQTSVAELVKRPDIARIVLSSGERFPGASSLSESNLWKKNLAIALQEKMQQPNLQAELPEQDAQEAQIVQESQAQQAEHERVAQARQQQNLIAQGNRQIAETAQQKIAAEQQAFQERLAQQREQDAIAEEVRGAPERDATANAALRAAEEAAQQGIAPIMPKAAESLQAGILTPEAATALRIRMTKEPLDLGDKATAASLAPQVDKRLALLEEAASRASAFELTDAQGNLNEQGHAYQRLLAQVTELRRIKGVLANTIENPVGAMRQMAGQVTGPAPQVGAVELRPLDQAHSAYDDAFSHAMGSLDQVARGEFTPEAEGTAVAEARGAGSGVVDAALKRINAARAERGQAPLTAEIVRTLRGRIQSAYDALVARARRYDASQVIGKGKNRTTVERRRAQTDESFGHIYGEPTDKNEKGTQLDTLTKVIKRFHAYVDSLEGERPAKETLSPITHKMIQAPLLETQTEESLAQQRAAAQGEGRPGKGQLLSHVEQTLGEIETMLAGRPQKKTVPVPKKGKGLADMANLMKANYEARVANSVRQNMDPDTRGLLGKVQQFLMSGVESSVKREEDKQGNVLVLNRSATPVGEETERYPLNTQLNARFTPQFLDDVDAIVMRARNTVAPDPALAQRVLDHINSIERNQQDERRQGDLFEAEKVVPVDDAKLERTRKLFALEKQNAAKTGRLGHEIGNLEKRVSEQDALLKSLAHEEKTQFAAMEAIDDLTKRVRELDTQLGDEEPSAALEGLRDSLTRAERSLETSTHFYGDAIQRFHDAKQAMDRMLTSFYSLRSAQERIDAISGTSRTIRALEASLKTNRNADTVRTQLLETAVRNVEILQKQLAKLKGQKRSTVMVKGALEKAKNQLNEATARADRLLAKPQTKEVPGPTYHAPEGKATSQPKAVEPGTTVTTSTVEAAPLEKLTTEESMAYAKATREFEDNLGRKATRKEKAEILHDLRATTPALRQTVERTVVETQAEKREAEKERIREEMEDRRRQRESMREQKVKGIVEPLTLKQRAELLRAEDAAVIALEQAKRAVPPARAAVIRANEINKAHPTPENAARAVAASDTFKAALKAEKAAKAAKKEATAALNAKNRLINKSAKETAAMRREAAGAAASRKGEQVRKNLPSTGKGAPEIGLRASRQETSGVAEFGMPPEKPFKVVKGKSAATKSIEKQIETEQATVARLEARKAAAIAAALEKGRKLTDENSPSLFALTHSIVQSKQKLVNLNKQLAVADQQEEIRKSHERQAARQVALAEGAAKKKPDVQHSNTPSTGTSTVAALEAEIAAEFGDTKGKVTVVPTRADMPVPGRAVTIDGNHVYIAADEVGPGQARGLVLHELGVHVGMDEDTVAEAHAALEDMVRNGDEHSDLAAKALAMQKKSASTDTRDEAVAHFVELASNAGVKPTEGAAKFFKPLMDWARKLLAKFGLANDKLTTQDIVDMARGAADKALQESKQKAGTVQYSSTPKYAADYDTRSKDIQDRLISKPTPLAARIKEFVHGFRANILDNYDMNVKFADMMKDQTAASQMMYDLRMHEMAGHATKEVITNGPLQIHEYKNAAGRLRRMVKSSKGPNLIDAAKELGNTGVGDFDAADRAVKTYLIAERAEIDGYDTVADFLPEGTKEKPRVTEAELKYELAKGRANPVFQKIRAINKSYSEGLIDFLVQTGAMSKVKADNLKAGGNYVSFYRKDGDTVSLMINNERVYTVGNITSQPHLKSLVGSNMPITGFLEGALQNTRLLTEMALSNLATKSTAETMNKVTYLDENGKPQPAAVVHNGTGGKGNNILRYKNKGEDKFAVINTEAFGLSSEMFTTGMSGVATQITTPHRLLAAPARVLRKFVVRNPLYGARILVRDSISNAVVAGVDGVPVGTQLLEMGKMLAGKSKTEKMLQERLITGGQTITGTTEDQATILKQLASGKAGWHTAMAWLDAGASKADAASRVTAYKSAIANGLDDLDATMAALETMNFTRHGAMPWVRHANSLIPFFNAQLQGLDVMYRSLTGKMPYNEQLKIRQKLITRGGMLFASSLAYAAMMQGDDDYENASMQERFNNWFVSTPWGTMRVPIPFEAGFLFKALPEALVASMQKNNEGAAVLAGLAQVFSSTTTPGFIPQGAKPLIEEALNREFFTGRDIEDTRMQGVQIAERYGDKTKEISKALSVSFDVAGREMGVSPARIEHLVRGYTGALGIAVLGLVDGLMSTASAKPTPKPNERPITGPLFVEEDAAGIINRAYTLIEEYGRIKGSYDKMVAEGREDDADRYAEKYADQLSKVKMAEKIKADLGKMSKWEALIRNDSDMTSDEKRAELDDLRREKIALSREAMEALRE